MANDVVASGTNGAGGLTDNEKMLSAAGYVIICCAMPFFLIPIFGAKQSRFAQYHGRQGAALYVVAIGGTIVLYVFQFVLTVLGRAIGFGYLHCIASLLLLLVAGFCFVLMVIGIINAMQGQQKPLPVLAPLAAKMPF